MERYTEGRLIIAVVEEGQDIETLELQFVPDELVNNAQAQYDTVVIPNSSLPVHYWVAGSETLKFETHFFGTPDEVKESLNWCKRLTRGKKVALILGELFEGMEWVTNNVSSSLTDIRDDFRPGKVKISFDFSLALREE